MFQYAWRGQCLYCLLTICTDHEINNKDVYFTLQNGEVVHGPVRNNHASEIDTDTNSEKTVEHRSLLQHVLRRRRRHAHHEVENNRLEDHSLPPREIDNPNNWKEGIHYHHHHHYKCNTRKVTNVLTN